MWPCPGSCIKAWVIFIRRKWMRIRMRNKILVIYINAAFLSSCVWVTFSGVMQMLCPLWVSADLLQKPRLLKSLTCYLDKLSISLYPSLEKFEEDLLLLLNMDRLNQVGFISKPRVVSQKWTSIKVCDLVVNTDSFTLSPWLCVCGVCIPFWCHSGFLTQSIDRCPAMQWHPIQFPMVCVLCFWDWCRPTSPLPTAIMDYGWLSEIAKSYSVYSDWFFVSHC